MTTRLIAADVPAVSDHDSRAARQRFEAFVRTLAELGDADRSGLVPLELDEALPTRRINRTRKLLGDRPPAGKSRSFARRLR